MSRFLRACGQPQQGIPTVHVTGTSGKGSVSAMVAGVLREAGLCVGLHVSPYLQSATEKLWVDDALASGEELWELVDWILPVAKSRLNPDTPASIHGMASVAIAFEHFRRKRVDVMVCEVGCGGRFDLTSFVDTIVAVVTNVGLDHLATLGPTLADIAWHKAGILRCGAPVVCGASGESGEIVRRESQLVGAPFLEIPLGEDAWDHNRAMAERAARLAAERLGVHLDSGHIERGLTRIPLPGRAEIMAQPGPRIVLDGAHNREKLAVATSRAAALAQGGPLIAVLGLLGAKASPQTLEPLAKACDMAVVTQPRVYGKPASPAEQTAAMCRDAGLSCVITVDPLQALSRAIELAGAGGTVFATGSFYLVGELRDRFFPKRAVVEQRTSFPTSAASSLQ